MVAAIDFDHTIWDTPNSVPLPGAREGINALRENGIKVIIHSCNNKAWIEKCLNNNDIRFDWIWDQAGKPVADIYIDDRGYHFRSWDLWEVQNMIAHINEGNPMIVRA